MPTENISAIKQDASSLYRFLDCSVCPRPWPQ